MHLSWNPVHIWSVHHYTLYHSQFHFRISWHKFFFPLGALLPPPTVQNMKIFVKVKKIKSMSLYHRDVGVIWDMRKLERVSISSYWGVLTCTSIDLSFSAYFECFCTNLFMSEISYISMCVCVSFSYVEPSTYVFELLCSVVILFSWCTPFWPYKS